jgi:hypothetical protein
VECYTFNEFYQTILGFLTAHSPQQLFSQLTATFLQPQLNQKHPRCREKIIKRGGKEILHNESTLVCCKDVLLGVVEESFYSPQAPSSCWKLLGESDLAGTPDWFGVPSDQVQVPRRRDLAG